MLLGSAEGNVSKSLKSCTRLVPTEMKLSFFSDHLLMSPSDAAWQPCKRTNCSVRAAELCGRANVA